MSRSGQQWEARGKHPRCSLGGRLGRRDSRRRRAAFTLIELLTVIAIIGVLASLLMTALVSAKKKSRATVCTFNLHQISLAVNMYIDDFGKRPTVEELASRKFLTSPRSLLCPEDKAGNWGGLVSTAGSLVVASPLGPEPVANSPEPVTFSYLLHPLGWDLAAWNRLMQAGSAAGFAACQLHGLGSQDVPDVRSYSGLLLRAQRDGAVVRRQVFWGAHSAAGIASNPPGTGEPGDSAFVALGNGGTAVLLSLPAYPVQLFVDDASSWLQPVIPWPETNP